MRCLGNPHPRKLCPAIDSTCNKSSKKRHWAKACRSGENWGSPSKHLNEISQQSSDEETYFLGTIGTPDELNDPWVTNLQLNETNVSFKIESGADATVVPYKMYQSIRPPIPLLQTKKILRGPCSHKLEIKGTFKTLLETRDCATEEEIFVVNGLERGLLGREAAQRLKLINRIESITTPLTKETIQHCSVVWAR